jgi:hypothetical protein
MQLCWLVFTRLIGYDRLVWNIRGIVILRDNPKYPKIFAQCSLSADPTTYAPELNLSISDMKMYLLRTLFFFSR